MRLLLLTLIFACPSIAYGDAFRLKELYLVGRNYGDGSREPIIERPHLDNKLDKELSLVWNAEAFNYFFWDNKVIGLIDKKTNGEHSDQFRLIGWEYEAGVRLASFLTVGWYHYSQHILDARYSETEEIRFPVKDAVSIRLYIYENEDRRGLISWD